MKWLLQVVFIAIVAYLAYGFYMATEPTFTIEEISVMPKGEAGDCYFPGQSIPDGCKGIYENHSGYVMFCCK